MPLENSPTRTPASRANTAGPGLPFEGPLVDQDNVAADREARACAVDPTRNVALEASAGTGKTRVLVDRYVNLLRAGVDPVHILAITFTRKAAAEMRDRIVATLGEAAGRREIDPARWRALKDRLGEIGISTIDAFCLSLLREFPLEADLDPTFDLADEAEVPRLIDEALDRTLRIGRAVARTDQDVALLFAQLAEWKMRDGLAAILARRLVAPQALDRFLASGPRDLTAHRACAHAIQRLGDRLRSVDGGIEQFIAEGPRGHPRFRLLARDLRRVCDMTDGTLGRWPESGARAAIEHLRDHFLNQRDEPREKLPDVYHRAHCEPPSGWDRHRRAIRALAPAVRDVIRGFHRDLNVVLARGVRRLVSIAAQEYHRTLDAHAVVDFDEVLARALGLLRQMGEFAQSRYRLESRYHHVLVDEFQDTNRAQWELIALLIRSWGEGFGLVSEGPLQPSIFIVGDRKQSIYGFRDADVAVLDDAARAIEHLRPHDRPRQVLRQSFRATRPLLAFANDLFAAVPRTDGRRDAFTFGGSDRFPLAADVDPLPADSLGIVATEGVSASADAVASEIDRLLGDEQELIRDRDTGLRRRVQPADVAILFRSRESHREFARALETRGVPAYVYKGLGFFDADEIQDVIALLRYLADPHSDLRAAAFLRSRLVRLSDPAVRLLAPDLAHAIVGPAPSAEEQLDLEDRRVLHLLRDRVPQWLDAVDRVPPAELLDRVLAETAYAYELGRGSQPRENVKKIRAMIRRIQNRGYATVGRIAEHVDRLSAGDEANAVIDAVDAVHLMTVHAAKGLEFPIVFIVNLTRGASGRRPAVRIMADRRDGEPSVSIGEYESEADEDAKHRDLEETKRLLYVAVTRARDRLYLCSTLRAGMWSPGPGSLGKVIPSEVANLFPRAAASAGDTVEWSVEDRRHRFRVVAPPLPSEGNLSPRVPDPATDSSDGFITSPTAVVLRQAGPEHRSFLRQAQDERCRRAQGERPKTARAEPRRSMNVAQPWPVELRTRGYGTGLSGSSDFRPLRDDAPQPRLSVGAYIAASDVAPRSVSEKREHAPSEVGSPPAAQAAADDEEKVLVGRLVHRLLEHAGLSNDPAAPADHAALAAMLVSADELLDVTEPELLYAQAAASFDRIRGRSDVSALLQAGQAHYEVPFSLRWDAGFLRGAIDCIVSRPDGGVTVVEFKTGHPRPEHQRQLELYVAAARELFPGVDVDRLLVYA